MRKKIISILLAIVMLVGVMPFGAISAFAAEGVKYLEYNTETGAFDELTCTNYTPLADDVTEWTGGWYVAPASKLELGEVNVNGSVYLILTDECELIVNGGIHVNEGNSITIYAQSNNESMGSLTATRGYFCAGIGGTDGHNGGNITIHGGKITAIGGNSSAGIGGGDNGSSSNITIYSGNITANGGDGGAGIGGGNYGGNGGNITIYGGTVTANSSVRGAGIGGGFHSAGGNVTIYGGTITANGGWLGYGVGGGYSSDGGNITIGGDTLLKANGGNRGINGTITLLGQVIIQDRISGRPVIVDSNETWRNVFYNSSVFVDIIDLNNKLNDCTAIISDTTEWASGWYSVSGKVTINSLVTVTGDVHLILMGGCDLTVNGGIKVENENSLNIYSLPNGEKSGSLTAYGNDGCAGIGSGVRTNCGNINIYGGNITATGGTYGAGIGGGYQSTGGHITICDGTVTAIGGYNAAGIGGYTDGYLTVTGGQVNATGGAGAAGIGGHYDSHGINITVTGGSVIAKAGEQEIAPVTGKLVKGNAIGHGGFSIDNGMFFSSSGVTLYRPDGSVIPYMKGGQYIAGYVSSFGETDEIIFYAHSSIDNYPYIEYNTSNKKFEKKYASNPHPLFNESTSWSAPWYVAENDVTIDSTVTVKGDVNLILKDGCKLEAKGGINVSKGNSLTIYAQSDGENMGILKAYGQYFGAGIGGAEGQSGGKITIHGGKIEATGDEYGGAGIGGGCYYIEYEFDEDRYDYEIYECGTAGEITIYGGDVTAKGGYEAAGIGGGYGCDGGKIKIYGDKVNATGGATSGYCFEDNVKGIGCGWFDISPDNEPYPLDWSDIRASYPVEGGGALPEEEPEDEPEEEPGIEPGGSQNTPESNLPTNPDTGDTENIVLWIVAFTAASTVFAVCLIYGRKKEKAE